MKDRSPRSNAKSLATLREAIDLELHAIIEACRCDEVHAMDAMRDCVTGPAKRVRPTLLILAVEDLGGSVSVARTAGCAVELVHCASLILDDLPCMDDSSHRRGRPTAHLRFGEDVAILTSVALLSEAFVVLTGLPDISGEQARMLTRSLGHAIGTRGLVAGQLADLRNPADLDAQQMLLINDRKTGSLFVTALEMAAILCDASPVQRAALRSCGTELGRAFQLFDDLLDIAGDPVTMGKPIGQDIGKAALMRKLDGVELLDRIETHVADAKSALGSLPFGAPGLQAFADHLFGGLRLADRTNGTAKHGLAQMLAH